MAQSMNDRRNAFKDIMMTINFEGENSKPMCDINAMKDIFDLIDFCDEKEFNALFRIYGMANRDGYVDGYRDGIYDAKHGSIHEEDLV